MNTKQDIRAGFEILPQAADMRVRVCGRTLKELFRNAVRGMACVVAPSVLESGRGAGRIRHPVAVEAVDINSLLIEFLSEVIAQSDIRGAVFTSVNFRAFGENFLEGEISGAPVQGLSRDIRAVSYHEVDVKKNPVNGLFETTLVFDI